MADARTLNPRATVTLADAANYGEGDSLTRGATTYTIQDKETDDAFAFLTLQRP